MEDFVDLQEMLKNDYLSLKNFRDDLISWCIEVIEPKDDEPFFKTNSTNTGGRMNESYFEARKYFLNKYPHHCPFIFKNQKTFEDFRNYLDVTYPISQQNSKWHRREYIIKGFSFLIRHIHLLNDSSGIGDKVPIELKNQYVSCLLFLHTDAIVCATVLRTSLQRFLRKYAGIIGQKDLSAEIGCFYNQNRSKLKSVQLHSKQYLDIIRKIGNEAVHPENDSELNPEDLKVAIVQYKKILNGFFQEIPSLKDEEDKIKNIDKKYTK